MPIVCIVCVSLLSLRVCVYIVRACVCVYIVVLMCVSAMCACAPLRILILPCSAQRFLLSHLNVASIVWLRLHCCIARYLN